MDYKIYKDFYNYHIYNDGRVWSVKRNIFLKGGRNSRGYLAINLYRKNNSRITHLIHILIGLLFIPNPENKCSIDHINNNKFDNRVENLRWATRIEQGHNRPKQNNNTSGFKGISFCKTHNTWSSKLVINQKAYKKCFKSKEEAIAYRRELEIKYLGEDYIV